MKNKPHDPSIIRTAEKKKIPKRHLLNVVKVGRGYQAMILVAFDWLQAF